MGLPVIVLPRSTVGFVFSILRISPTIFGGHIKLNVPPKLDYTTHATTSDYDDLRTPDPSGDCLWDVCATAVV